MNLVIENLCVALRDFDLRLDLSVKGESLGIFGPSGSGKTTLLDSLAGLRPLKSGKVQWDGEEWENATTRTRVSPSLRGIGYVPQDLALFPHLNVRRNLEFGQKPGAESRFSLERVSDLLEIRPLWDAPIHKLSGGEKSRVALGRALCSAPRLLLLDEPLVSLDSRLKRKIIGYFKQILSEFKIPLIYVTHSEDEIDQLCEERVTLELGRIGEGA